MNHTLEQLIKLQGIDLRLLEIKDFMGDLPLKVKTQEEELASLDSDNEGKQNRIIEIEKDNSMRFSIHMSKHIGTLRIMFTS